MRRKPDAPPPRVDTPSPSQQDRATSGPLVLIGGACTPNGEALRTFIDLAREAGGPIVGISAASENPVESARLWRADFRVAGVQETQSSFCDPQANRRRDRYCQQREAG